MKLGRDRLLWSLAVALVAATGLRLFRSPDPYRAGAPLGIVEDRREHRFRNLSYAETQRLFDRFLQSAMQASDAPSRARWLARVASLQRERGFTEAADAAAREALRTAPGDLETQRLLAAPLDLRTLR